MSYQSSFIPEEGAWSTDRSTPQARPYNTTKRYTYRQQAIKMYQQCAQVAQDEDLKAKAYIAMADIYMYPEWDLEKAREGYRTFVQLFPRHTWANNAQIWIARTHVLQAKSLGESDPQKKLHLQSALLEYEVVLQSYPDGHVGAEAKEEIREIQSRLDQIK